jgi:glycosyltransferase involved in cell wall biosynthesis
MSGTHERVRVLWLINGLGPGGAERLLHSHARVADRERFDYEVAYLLRRKSALAADLERAGVPAHPLGARRRTDVAAFRRLRRLIRDGRYDVLHVHSPLVGGVARAVVRTLPRDRRPIVVSTEHNEWSSFKPPTRLLNAAMFRGDAAHWAVSEQVRQSIWPSRRDRVEVVVHGLVLDDVARDEGVRAAVRAELGAAPDDVVIGTVANYRVQKAYPDLLHAARAVLDADPRVLFVAVGQGPLQGEIRALHDRLGLGDRFLHLGQRDDVPRLLSGWDVFTLASHYEGFPVSVMEALAAGLPLVVTDVGGIAAAVTDGVNGRLVRPGRPDELAAALLDVARDADARARMGVAAYTEGRRYDIRRAAGRIEQVYLDLVEARRGAGSVVEHVA